MPEQTMAEPCGLLTREGAPVPLTGVTVDADVRAVGARVTVTQRYGNVETQPIEAVHVFPLDAGAAVCGFEAVIDGVRVAGEVKEREDASRACDDAMAEGHGAYLLDEERPDVFQASIGNLPPNAAVALTIVYVVELDVVEDAVRFAVPTTVAPRYAPPEDRLAVGRRDALVVSLAQHGTPLDRDFVLSVEGGGFEAPSAWIETGPGGARGAGAIDGAGPAAAPAPHREHASLARAA